MPSLQAIESVTNRRASSSNSMWSTRSSVVRPTRDTRDTAMMPRTKKTARRAAEIVTATDADTVMARIPVA
nr:hypothetical protein [Saccharothrix texasensis]